MPYDEGEAQYGSVSPWCQAATCWRGRTRETSPGGQVLLPEDDME